MTESVQPRFESEWVYINKFIKLVENSEFVMPDYSSNTKKRDMALRQLVRSENLLSGTVAAAVSKDKNRNFELTGTARQISAFGKKLHMVHDGIGWRQFISLNAESFYTTNFGYASEIGFDFKGGRAQTLWNLDPTRCQLTDNYDQAVIYTPRNNPFFDKGRILLSRNEIIHGNSMPSIEEDMNRAGFCAVERALTWVKIMLGIYENQLEKLGLKLPKGIMHIKGITEFEWSAAKDQYEEERKSADKSSSFYEEVFAIFTQNEAAKIELINLSQLPENFNLREFVDVLMNGYALAFGLPVGSLWAVAGGAFGRSSENKVQAEQASYMAEFDFSLSFEEQLQTYFLPPSVLFNFDKRNNEGDLISLEVEQSKVNLIISMYKAGLKEGNPLIDKNQAQILLSEMGVIDPDWVEGESDIVTLEEKELRDRVLSTPELVAVMKRYPQEPVVRYRYGDNNQFKIFKKLGSVKRAKFENYYEYPAGEVSILFESGEDALAKKIF